MENLVVNLVIASVVKSASMVGSVEISVDVVISAVDFAAVDDANTSAVGPSVTGESEVMICVTSGVVV